MVNYLILSLIVCHSLIIQLWQTIDENEQIQKDKKLFTTYLMPSVNVESASQPVEELFHHQRDGARPFDVRRMTCIFYVT